MKMKKLLFVLTTLLSILQANAQINPTTGIKGGSPIKRQFLVTDTRNGSPTKGQLIYKDFIDEVATAYDSIPGLSPDVTRYIGNGTPGFTPVGTSPRLAQGLTAPYPLYQHNGTSWDMLLPSDTTVIGIYDYNYDAFSTRTIDHIALIENGGHVLSRMADGWHGFRMNMPAIVDAGFSMTVSNLGYKQVSAGIWQTSTGIATVRNGDILYVKKKGASVGGFAAWRVVKNSNNYTMANTVEAVSATNYPVKLALDSIKIGGTVIGTTNKMVGTKINATTVQIETIDTSGFPTQTLSYDGVTYNFVKARLRNNNTDWAYNTVVNKWTLTDGQLLTKINFPTLGTANTLITTIVDASDSSVWLVKKLKNVNTYVRQSDIDSIGVPTAYFKIGGNDFWQGDVNWNNPNISVNVGETIKFSYDNGVWEKESYYLSDFGAKPLSNSSAALTKAILTTNNIKITNNYIIESRITLTKDSVTFQGDGKSSLIWKGGFDKMFNISGKYLVFNDLIIDGGFSEVKGSLIYLCPNSSVTFNNCVFRNINGTHTNGYFNNTNNQYMIQSSKENTNLQCNNCSFSNIKNNNLINTEGVGFVGAYLALDSSFVDPIQISSATANFISCKFLDIQTVMNTGLTSEQKITYDDGDAVRFYGDINTDKVFSNITDCSFVNISKRAVKISDVYGVTITNAKVTDTNLPYPMTTIIKVGNGTVVNGLTVNVNKSSNSVFQSHTSSNVTIKNVKVNKVNYFYNFTPGTSTDRVRNISISDITIDSLYTQFFQQSIAIDSVNNFSFKDVFVNGVSNNTIGFVAPFSTIPTRAFYKCDNLNFKNTTMKFSSGGIIDKVNLVIQNANFVGGSNSLVEDNSNSISNLNIDIQDISGSFKTATKFYYYVYGDKMNVLNTTIKVASSLSSNTNYDVVFNTTNSVISNTTYDGVGRLMLGYYNNSLSVKRNYFNGIQRLRNVTTPVLTFLDCYKLDSSVVKDVTDYSIFAGAYTVLYDVTSNNNTAIEIKSNTVIPLRNDGTGNIYKYYSSAVLATGTFTSASLASSADVAITGTTTNVVVGDPIQYGLSAALPVGVVVKSVRAISTTQFELVLTNQTLSAITVPNLTVKFKQ